MQQTPLKNDDQEETAVDRACITERTLPTEPLWRPASEPTCCGSGCDDCPF
jgi:hypothetical protein